MALPSPVVEPPPRLTTAEAPLARKAWSALSVTSTGVCMAAPGKIPTARPRRLSASFSASAFWCGVESTSALSWPSLRTSSSTRAMVPAPNTTRVVRPGKMKLSIIDRPPSSEAVRRRGPPESRPASRFLRRKPHGRGPGTDRPAASSRARPVIASRPRRPTAESTDRRRRRKGKPASRPARRRIVHLQERRSGNPSAPPRRPAGANLRKDTRWRGRRLARSRPEALAVGAPHPGPPPLRLRDGRAHRKAVCERQASADRRRARPTSRRAARAAGQRSRIARRAAPPHATASPRGTDRGRGRRRRLPSPPSRSALVAACDHLSSHEFGLLEAGPQFVLTVLEPGRENQRLANRVGRLVAGPALRRGPGDLEQRAAGRADIARLEVVAIFLLGNVGEAQALNVRAQLQLVVFVARIEGDVVDRAAGQRPGALPAVAVDDHLDALDDTRGVGHPEDQPLVIVGFLLERQRDGQEIIHRRPIHYGDDRAIDALDPVRRTDALRRIDNRLAGIAVAFHQFVRDPAGMREDRAISAKARDLCGWDAARVQPLNPEIRRPLGDRLQDGARLVRPPPAEYARLAKGKCRDDGRGVAFRRAIIEMVDWDHAVEKHRPLH